MKKLSIILLAAVFCLGLSGIAVAGNEATQTATYQIDAINELSAAGTPAAFIVSTATAGSEPAEIVDTSTTYAITTNCDTNAKKITAEINTAMPSNTELKITLVAPAGASSEGEQLLSRTALDVVTGIDAVASSGHQITYKFIPTVSAGVIGSAQKTVTLTLTNS